MSQDHKPNEEVTDVFKALGDPIRWWIVKRMSEVDELACSTLEDNLPISKPTISYHIKILQQAGLLTVRKQGRSIYYTMRREALEAIVDEVWALAPKPRPVREGHIDHQPLSGRRSRNRVASHDDRPQRAEGQQEATILTW